MYVASWADESVSLRATQLLTASFSDRQACTIKVAQWLIVRLSALHNPDPFSMSWEWANWELTVNKHDCGEKKMYELPVQ